MKKYAAKQDFVLAGRKVVRRGEVIALPDSAAKYPRLRGWIEPAAALEETGEAKPAPRRPRK